MSRVGRIPIPLPPDVAVDIKGNEVIVRGTKGELRRCFHPHMSITLKDGNLVVSRPNNEKNYAALHGLTRSLLANMIAGVSKGFEKNLVIVGVGYRAQKVADKLVLQVGHTHRVEISPPAGISFALEGANRIKVIGVDKELVGDVAAKIRAIRPPDAYKGKGIRYQEERIHLKAGKGGRVAGKRK